MTPEEDATWEVLCLQYPNAAPFRNCGWEIYDDVKKLCPNKAKGTHSFYPSNGTQGVRDPTSAASAEVLQANEEPLTRRFSPEWDEAALDATFRQGPLDEDALTLPETVGTEAGNASHWPGFRVDGNLLANSHDGTDLEQSKVCHNCLYDSTHYSCNPRKSLLLLRLRSSQAERERTHPPLSLHLPQFQQSGELCIQLKHLLV